MAAARHQAQERRLDRLVAERAGDARGRAGGRPAPAAAARAAASALADDTPTSSAPISPGPARDRHAVHVVEADARRARARPSITASTSSRWRRDAISGHHAAVARRAAGPGRRPRSSGSRPSSVTTRGAGVVAARLDRRGSRGGARSGPAVAPHDQGVLAVVVVVAAAAAGGAEAEALVQARSPPSFEVRTSSVYCSPGLSACSNRRSQQRGGDALARAAGRRPRRSSRARPCRSASRPGSRRAARRSSAARQMPDGLDSSSTNIASDHGRRERAPLDRDHLRQVGVGQPADLGGRWSRCGFASGALR